MLTHGPSPGYGSSSTSGVRYVQQQTRDSSVSPSRPSSQTVTALHRPFAPNVGSKARPAAAKVNAATTMSYGNSKHHHAPVSSPQSSASSSCGSSNGSGSSGGSSDDLRRDLAASLLQVVEEGQILNTNADSPLTSSSEPTSPAKPNAPAPPPAAGVFNPKKSGRRHSQHGMSTPDTVGEGVNAEQPRRKDLSEDDGMRPARRKVHRVAGNNDGADSDSRGNSSSSSPANSSPKRAASPLQHAQRMDIATFPAATLLHLLAELLAEITVANDVPTPRSSGQAALVSNSGAVTPPFSQKANEPVTPAVPFSSPVVAPHSPSKGKGRSPIETPGYPFPEHQALHNGPSPRKKFATPDSVPLLLSQMQQIHPPTLLTSAAAALSTPNATLCFHARNVPSISIESYLVRISKYCPTTNEVFISLLIYFDRMSRLNLSGSTRDKSVGTPTASLSQTFAIDSFNVHRLIISAVTVASKFFSDIFYTNSRYAKVGGLPLQELNALELQFLLLNAFALTTPAEEIQLYGDYLVSHGCLPPLSEINFPATAYPHQSLPDQSIETTQAAPSPLTQARQLNTQISVNPEMFGSASERPKNSFRSASESSTSASESSTVVPSEDSVSTQRAGDDAEEAHDVNEEGRADASPRPSVAPIRKDRSKAEKATRRDDSRTREWTMTQQQNQELAHSPSASTAHSDDTEMSEE